MTLGSCYSLCTWNIIHRIWRHANILMLEEQKANFDKVREISILLFIKFCTVFLSAKNATIRMRGGHVMCNQEGGSVSRVNIGRLITTSVTSRHTSMFFKMAGNFLVLYFCKR